MTTKKKELLPSPPPSRSEFDLRGDPTHGYNRLREIAFAHGWRNGCHTAARLDRALTYQIRKIPTGIFMLDWLLHGGLPFDRITRVSGSKNTCKTTTMLKVLANTQNYCRMCKCPIVVSPYDGTKDCECPKPRFKLVDETILQYLERDEDAFALIKGMLPENVKRDKSGYYVVTEDNKHKSRIEEQYRCVPMQCVLIEAEHKMDAKWAMHLGVDLGLVIVVSSDWAESTLDTVEAILYSGEADMLFVDTLSMLVPKGAIAKSMEDTPKIAEKATMIQRFLQKTIAAQNSGGVLNATPLTIMCNSQVRTKGIGGFRTFLGTSDGNAMDHCTTVDLSFREKGYIWEHNEYASYGQYEFTVMKNHAGGSGGVSGTFKMWLDPKGPYKVGDTDDVGQVINYGRSTGLISEAKNKYWIKSSYLKKETSFSTLKALENFLLKNPTVFSDLRRRVLDGLLGYRTPKKQKKEKEGDSKK